MNFIVSIRSKCRQGGGGQKIRKLCGHHIRKISKEVKGHNHQIHHRARRSNGMEVWRYAFVALLVAFVCDAAMADKEEEEDNEPLVDVPAKEDEDVVRGRTINKCFCSSALNIINPRSRATVLSRRGETRFICINKCPSSHPGQGRSLRGEARGEEDDVQAARADGGGEGRSVPAQGHEVRRLSGRIS